MTRASQLTTQARTLRHRMWGESVTYTRKTTETELAITARKAGVRTAGPDGSDVVVQTELFDWVVTAADLVDGGEPFEPADGDTIVAVTDEETVTYLAGTYAGEPSCWEPADSDKYELVVHTKLWSEA